MISRSIPPMNSSCLQHPQSLKELVYAAATPVDPAEDGFLDGIGVRLRR